MSNVCMIPLFNRPELLYHTLQNISKARGIEEITFLFKPDYGFNRENLEVIAGFNTMRSHIVPPERCPYPFRSRQSYNLLKGYFHAAAMAGPQGTVYMVEDDVIVGPDFFTWHNEAQRSPNFCTIASADTNTPEHDRPAPDGTPHYRSHGTYRSIGVAFSARAIHDHILPHVTAAYFNQPQTYIRSKFSHNPWGATWTEQDGLIRRIQVNNLLPILYPHTPRCYHAGYYSGNRGTRNAPKGTLDQRIKQVGDTIYDTDRMKKAAGKPMYFDDSQPVTFA